MRARLGLGTSSASKSSTAGSSPGMRCAYFRSSGRRYAAGVTFLQAAEAVLRRAKKPMTAAEITDVALRRGLLQTSGKTPVATMSSRLYGRPSDSPIRRVFTPGTQRARRESVRWIYESKGP